MPTPQHQQAQQLVSEGRNLFLTGAGGVGKSHLTRDLIRARRKDGKKVFVTGSTGLAAIHLNGTTIHSYLGTGLAGSLREIYQRGLLQIAHDIQEDPFYDTEQSDVASRVARAGDRIRATDVLVLDEVSMITGDFLDMLDTWCKAWRRDPAPFGGIQVILVGDLGQLPAVVTRDQIKPEALYVFQAKSWPSITTVELQYIFRTSDRELQKHLADVRLGRVTDETLAYFNQRYVSDFDADNITRLYTTNRDVDTLNDAKMRQLPEPDYVFEATQIGNEGRCKRLLRNLPTSEKLVLRVGARVMIVKNASDGSYYNGQTGKVRQFYNGRRARVTLDSGHECTVSIERWCEEDDDGFLVAAVNQLPLRLAYAVTTHKSQGQTLTQFATDISSTFAAGQAYVALSRATTLEGLTLIKPITKKSIITDPVVVDFYESCRT